VVPFPYDERMVTTYQLSFFGHQVPLVQPSSPIVSCFLVVPSPQQVNYVTTHSIFASVDNHAYGLIHYVLGALEPDLSLVPNDMYSSQSLVLPSSEDLLGVMFLYGP